MRRRLSTGSLFKKVFDSSSLINIEKNKKIPVLRRRWTEVVIPKKVAEEVSGEDYPLKGFVAKHPDIVVSLTAEEERRYLEVRRQPGIHDGESAAIAVAQSRGFPLVIDDPRAKRKAENHGIPCSSWSDFVEGRV